MFLALLLLTLQAHPAAPEAGSPAAVADSARADSAGIRPGVVLELPAIEVRALLHDMKSSQTVHLIPDAVLRTFPVDRLADVVALQPGVVAQGEELHVRGGRHGETALNLDDLNLNEPFRHRPIDVPLFAIRSAELVSGNPEAQQTTGIAGGLNLRSVDPERRPAAGMRWKTDGRTDTRYDQIAGRASVPLGLYGLGLVAAGEGTFDDTYLPALRTPQRHEVAGVKLGWRAENRMSAYAKIAPVRNPERFSIQVLANRQVHRPYNLNFTVDGYVFVPVNLKETPKVSPVPLPGYLRYKAPDHVAITDDRQLAASIRVATRRAPTFASLSLGWLRTSTVTSMDGHREPASASHRPRYGNPLDSDVFYALWGDWPFYSQSDSDVLTLRADAGRTNAVGTVQGGFELRHEQVSLREMDWLPFTPRAGNDILPFPEDSIRAYGAAAPGGAAWVQGRWTAGGLILNMGLRADYFRPGSEAPRQTLPAEDRGIWSFGPRLGFAYPISVRDAFSFSYSRVHQSPARDYLYDQRKAITNRQPLGNPALEPYTMVSYEAAVKRLLTPDWAIQAAVFYRDVFGQVGALDAEIPEGPVNLRYVNADDSHTLGFEWTAVYTAGRQRFEAHYTWMNAWGNESRPEGDPYGAVRSLRTPSIGEQPVSWDRRHAFLVAGTWPVRRDLTVSWSTSLLSPLPWTPKERWRTFTDRALINSRRLGWTGTTNVDVRWTLPWARGLAFGVESRNLLDQRYETAATLDGYPNPISNTLYDDYGAYRTETGQGGGAYWSHLTRSWIPVNDPRLYGAPRTVRAMVEARW